MSDDNPNAALTGVTPHITIRDKRAQEAIAFYQRAFGAREVARSPAEDGERLMHAHLSLNGGALLLHDDFPEMAGGTEAPPPAGVVLHLQVADADSIWQQALAAGATMRFPLADQFWGDRYGQLTDPFGHVWSIAGPKKG